MSLPVDAIYDLGIPHNPFSLPLPDGTLYPKYATYQDVRGMEFLRAFDRVRDKDWSDCTFLDLGCSEGSTTMRIAQTGATVYGVEGRADGIERANVLKQIVGFDNVHFSVGNVNDDASFREVDGMFNAGVLYHLEDPVGYLERCARHTRQFMYLDSGFAPRSEQERQNSKRASGYGKEYKLNWRGLELDAVDFREPADVNEVQKDGTRRKPRSGIGNTNAVRLTPDSAIAVMRELGFPHHEVVSDRPVIPRLRICFYRDEPRPERDVTLTQPLPQPLPPLQAFEKTRERDLAYLKRVGRPVTVYGREPLMREVVADLKENGIAIAEAIAAPGSAGDPIGLAHVKNQLGDKSGLLALALEKPKDPVFRIMLLDRFDYVFPSFGLVTAARAAA